LPRSPNSSSDEILVNTLKLISEHGITSVTLDMVADVSRVSKATIYRRWPNREKLILSAMSYLEVPTEVPDTGDIVQDLTILLKNLIEFLNKPDGGRVYSSFLNASVHDEKFADFRHEVTTKAVVPYATVIKRGADRGDLKLGVPLRLAVDLLIAPFVYHRIATNSPARYADIDDVVRFFIRACAPAEPTT
jgi:AcrR family transcriptional regulator